MGKIEAQREGSDYGEVLRRSQSTESKIAALVRIGPRNLTDTTTDDKLFAHLIGNIAEKRPFSIVRLGDGEGNVLFWGSRRSEYPALARFGMECIWKLMFGRTSPDDDIYDRLYEGMAAAVRNADYLGIPVPEQDEHSIMLMCDPSQDTVGIRGTMGQAAVWDWICHHSIDRINDGDQILVNAHFHTSLPDFLEPIMRQAGNLSVITCHTDVLMRFGAQFGIEEGLTYLVPPQSSNIGQVPDLVHYPDRFQEIDEELRRQDLTGRLFFVGAGIAGKAYCDRIKRQGGMAIDVGSMMDVWMGLGVRQYQDAAFIAQCRLVDRPDAG